MLARLVAGDTEMRKVGRELHGACPFCVCQSTERRHRCDRFRVTADRWFCRQCMPNGGDAIAYVQKRDGLSFREACDLLGEPHRLTPSSYADMPVRRVDDEEPSPPSAWQARAAEYLAAAEAMLWSRDGVRALEYLHDTRGLSGDTIKRWRLGYQLAERREPAADWGLGGEPVWLPRGIVIPWLHHDDGEVWAIRVRRPTSGTHKYHSLRGSAFHLLYGAATVHAHQPAILLESELDVLLLDRYAGDVTASTSIAGTRADFTRRQLMVLRKAVPIHVAYDNDAPGRTAMHTIVGYGPRFRAVTWPAGVKDLGDVWRMGHDVRAWACDVLGVAAEARVPVVPTPVSDISDISDISDQRVPPPPPRRTCLGNGPCPKAVWRRRPWGGLVCEVCHP